jgi:EmrB/QacA subfamily drug resistance transporter
VPELSSRRRLAVLGICCLSLLIVSLDNTVVNVALPAMARGLHASVSGLQWIVDAYTMAMASLLMFAGATGDRFGRRGAFQVGLAVFTVASLLCSLAPSLGWLVGFRIMQAVGGSMLTPVGMSILSSVFTSGKERAWAIGVWVSMLGVGMAAGPVLGGVLTETVGWRGVFWVNVPVGLAASVLTRLLVPESRARGSRRPDPVAQILVVVMLGSVVYAIIQGAHSDWRASGIRDLFVAAAVAFLVLVVWEVRRTEPLIDPRFFRSPAFSGAVVTAVCAFACLSGFLFLSSIYLQDVRRLTPLAAGVHLLPTAVAIAVCPPLAAWLASRVDPRVPLMLGGLALTVSMAAMSRLTGSTGNAYLIATFAVFGFGMAMIDGQISSVAVSAMPLGQAGLASGIASTGRQVGQALGVAVGGSLLNAGMHGPMQAWFPRASHPAWAVLAGCGCTVTVLGLLTATVLRSAPLPVSGTPQPQAETPPPRSVSPQGAGRLWPRTPEWVPRYLMDLPPSGDPAAEAVTPVTAYHDHLFRRWQDRPDSTQPTRAGTLDPADVAATGTPVPTEPSSAGRRGPLSAAT